MRASCAKIGVESVQIVDFEDGFAAVWDTHRAVGLAKAWIAEKRIDSLLTFDFGGVSGHPNHIACFDVAVQLLSADLTARGSHGVSRVSRLRAVGFLETEPLYVKYAGCVPYAGDALCSRRRGGVAADARVKAWRRRLAESGVSGFCSESPGFADFLRRLDRPATTSMGAGGRGTGACGDVCGERLPFLCGETSLLKGWPWVSLSFLGVHASQMVWFRYLWCIFSSYFWRNHVVWVCMRGEDPFDVGES